MEQSTINHLIHYLQSSTFASATISPEDQKYIEKNLHNFTIYKDSLYRLQPNDLHCLKKVLNKDQIKEVFIQYHCHPLGGHFAFANTLNRIYQKYFWPTMNKDILKMVQSCERCQEHGPKQINERAHPVPVPVKPFTQVGLDIKHVTPSQSGHRYIIAAIDYLTKYVEVKAITTQTSSEIALFLYEDIISRHGCISILITDNGRPMISELVNKVCQNFGIRHKTISPYHSQSQGLIERFNRTLDSCLKKRTESEKANWDQYLPATAFAYRSIKQATTGQSPFFLLYGYEPQTYFDNTLRPIDVKEPSFALQLKIRTTIQIQHLNHIREEALNKIKKSQELQVKRLEKKMYNPKKEWKPSFNIGDVVKLYRDNISTSWSAKISIRWYEDNYCIQEKHRKGSYIIKNISNPDDPKLHLVHGNRLKPFISPAVKWEALSTELSN
ncbi:hypothetical protein G6F42_013892 [Rhizopus arrhizus]|nr:hypothetical protein G6F42_013892 [Rhizopus arrhizus]